MNDWKMRNTMLWLPRRKGIHASKPMLQIEWKYVKYQYACIYTCNFESDKHQVTDIISGRVIDDPAVNVHNSLQNRNKLASGWNMRESGLLYFTTNWPKKWRPWQLQQNRLLNSARICIRYKSLKSFQVPFVQRNGNFCSVSVQHPASFPVRAQDWP